MIGRWLFCHEVQEASIQALLIALPAVPFYGMAMMPHSMTRVPKSASASVRSSSTSLRFLPQRCFAGLTETCGQGAADDCAKMQRADLALACAKRIPGCGWLPPALRILEVKSAGEDEAFEIVDDVDHEDGGYSEYHPANDEEEFAVAAE